MSTAAAEEPEPSEEPAASEPEQREPEGHELEFPLASCVGHAGSRQADSTGRLTCNFNAECIENVGGATVTGCMISSNDTVGRIEGGGGGIYLRESPQVFFTENEVVSAEDKLPNLTCSLYLLSRDNGRVYDDMTELDAAMNNSQNSESCSSILSSEPVRLLISD